MKMLNFLNFALIFSTYSLISNAESSQTESIYTSFMKLNEKFDYLNEKIEKLEANPSPGSKFNVDEIKSNLKQMKSSIEDFDRKLAKIQQQSDKTDKTNQLLSELITYQTKKDSDAKSELGNALNNECYSMCQSKLDTWVNQTRVNLKTNVEAVETCLTNHSTATEDRKLSTACHPNPCLHGGRCALTSTGDYKCTECPYPTSGKHCEQLHCGDNRCFYRDEIFYELFDLAVSWDHAHRLCLRGGMTLAYSKDRETTEFLSAKLKSIYGGGHLWMGLKVNEAEKQWQWLDGSLLGDYTGNKANFKTHVGQHCAVLYLSGGNVLWEPFACTRGSFLLCEKRYLSR